MWFKIGKLFTFKFWESNRILGHFEMIISQHLQMHLSQMGRSIWTHLHSFLLFFKMKMFTILFILIIICVFVYMMCGWMEVRAQPCKVVLLLIHTFLHSVTSWAILPGQLFTFEGGGMYSCPLGSLLILSRCYSKSSKHSFNTFSRGISSIMAYILGEA